jgi:hypothetical protein
MALYLNPREIAVLFRQNPHTAHCGGFQWFLIQLQRRTNVNTGRIFLVPRDFERIFRYAFGYGNGGWENRLTQIFGRILGPNLDDPTASRFTPDTIPIAA